MAIFKVVTQRRPGVSYEHEMESLAPIDAEIVVVDATTEDEYIEAARNADAIIGGGRRITENVVNSLLQRVCSISVSIAVICCSPAVYCEDDWSKKDY